MMPEPHPLMRQNTYCPQHALTLLAHGSVWTNHPTPQHIQPIQLNLIAAYAYKPRHTQAALKRYAEHQAFQTIEFITYTFPDGLTYYVPDSEWHSIFAARQLGHAMIDGYLKGGYQCDPSCFYLNQEGLWQRWRPWRQAIDQGDLRLYKRRNLSMSLLELLRVLGVTDQAQPQDSTLVAA